MGLRFHGLNAERTADVRKNGLQHGKYAENIVHVSDAQAADSVLYSKVGKKDAPELSAVHVIPEGYAEKKIKEGKLVGNDTYAGHEERHLMFDIPPEDFKTLIMKVKKKGVSKEDPILAEAEKRLNAQGKTMGSRKNIPELQHEINYNLAIIAEDAYEKHGNEMKKEAEQLLKKQGKVSFSEMKKKADEIGIRHDATDQVIGNVFLDMNLKKSRNSFKG